MLLMCVVLGACVNVTARRTGSAGDVPPDSTVQVWITTPDKAKLLAREPDIPLSRPDTVPPQIEVDQATLLQEIVGFGAALTDASAWLIENRMSESQRDALLHELFDRGGGLGLGFVRLTIGASDFSRSHYTFDDVPAGTEDAALARFSIAPNRQDLLPLIKRVRAINPGLTIMATPWSAPAWMKTSGTLAGGTLRLAAYSSFAEYLARYIEAYAAEGVPIELISLQNEPDNEPSDYPGMRLSPAQRADLLSHYVGPLFARRNIRARILEWDHNWDEPESPLAVLADSAARKFVDGVAWHCYKGDVSAQSTVRDAHPAKDVYFTECSGGDWAPNWDDNLQWSVRTLVVGTMRNWARGVLLWNLALDEHHGPHLGGCNDCRGVVTIDSLSGTVSRNEEYYALAHVSRFVRPGAHRIPSTSGSPGLEAVAFKNADDGSKVLVAVNVTLASMRATVRIAEQKFEFVLPAGAVGTYRWR